MSNDLATLDAIAQAELVRRQQVSPRELTDAAIARIEKVNPQLKAVIHPLFDKARQQAAAELPDGPFRGVPFLLKDLDALSAGDPYHGGTQFLRDLRWAPDHDSYLVTKLRAAGFVVVGKTNTPELGLNVTTEPKAHGASRNPWNTAHSTGGSSGGSAAAVAALMVPAAHASDGGGSIRIPASECGLVGLKPSRGRVSLGPDYGEYWHGLVISHAVTRSVRDSAAILDAIAGAMPGDPYFAPPPQRPFLAEVGADPGRLRIGTMARAPGGAPQYLQTIAWLQAFTRRMASWWANGFDVLLTPTIAAPPPKLGELVPPPGNPLAGAEKVLGLIPFTPQFNITGQPAMSLPLHWNGEGLPIGVQLVGAYGHEDLLFRLAAQVEGAKPWRDRLPEIHA